MEIASWIAFITFILAMLLLDLFIFRRKSHEIELKEALIWSGIWIGLSMLFFVGVWLFLGKEAGLNFLAGYLIEKALSVDNLFVFLLIFTQFSVPKRYLHSVLFWGVVGALIMRGFFIFAGIALINSFHWIIYLFGFLLIYAGIMMNCNSKKKIDFKNSFIIRICRKVYPITPNYENGYFFIKREGTYWATPLLLVLLAVETSDLIFAIDSVPAILAITNDPFIVFSSNVFAILGLRSLYFALEKMMGALYYLPLGLSALLIFFGFKMLFADIYPISVTTSLLVITLILGVAILASWIKGKEGGTL